MNFTPDERAWKVFEMTLELAASLAKLHPEMNGVEIAALLRSMKPPKPEGDK